MVLFDSTTSLDQQLADCGYLLLNSPVFRCTMNRTSFITAGSFAGTQQDPEGGMYRTGFLVLQHSRNLIRAVCLQP